MKLTEKKTNDSSDKALACLSHGLSAKCISKSQMHFKVPSLLVVAIYSLYKKHKLYTSIRALNITAQQAFAFQTGPLWTPLSKECAPLFTDIYIKI